MQKQKSDIKALVSEINENPETALSAPIQLMRLMEKDSAVASHVVQELSPCSLANMVYRDQGFFQSRFLELEGNLYAQKVVPHLVERLNKINPCPLAISLQTHLGKLVEKTPNLEPQIRSTIRESVLRNSPELSSALDTAQAINLKPSTPNAGGVAGSVKAQKLTKALSL